MSYFKKIAKLLLISILTILLIVPAAIANEQKTILFNGQDYQADYYVENGVTYISTASLSKIPGLKVPQDSYVALRNFFENYGGKVTWDNVNNQIIVSWRENKDKWTAEELMVESTKKMLEYNTYKMKSEATMKMNMAETAQTDNTEVIETNFLQEIDYQQNPLAMYIKQTVKIPVEYMELSEEEAAIFNEGEMVTEMVFKDNAIYQKMPSFNQWIVQDLSELGMMNNITNMIQTSPQQSLELMSKFGMINVFGEDVVIDGKEYYTVKTYIDTASFKKMTEELLGELDFVDLLSNTQEFAELDEEEKTEITDETQKVINQILNNLKLDYYIDSFINKETLLTEYMKLNLDMNLAFDETINPEDPINLDMNMTGEYELFDFGSEVQLPDLSEAITQEEFLKQVEEMMATPEESAEQTE